MKEQQNENKPNMPKFNMSWIYIIILVMLGVLYFTSTDDTGTGSSGSGGISKKENYTNFKEWVTRGAAEEVVINNEENTLRMYVKPEFIQKVFETSVQHTGKNPYLEVEFGSVETLEAFLDKQKEAGHFNGNINYKNEKSGDMFNMFFNIFSVLFFVIIMDG